LALRKREIGAIKDGGFYGRRWIGKRKKYRGGNEVGK